MRKRLVRIAATIFCILILAIGLIALRIYSYGHTVDNLRADAAIVLGAAVWGSEVSPVFKERIDHALELYRSGRVRKIIFTGGQGNRSEPTESSAARQYAIEQGVPPADILVEEKSHTTYENLLFAREVVASRGLKRVLIVSDPLHMRRAVTMASDLGLEAYSSPTPTTRYQSTTAQIGLLSHETYYYIGYLFRRSFMKQPAFQPRSDYEMRVGAVLPGNWDVSESNNQIVIFRNGRVRVYSCIGIDVGLLIHPHLLRKYVEEIGEDQDYKIRMRIGPKIEFPEYSRLKEFNDKITVTKGTMLANREFFEDQAMKSFDPIYQELPEYYDEHSSIYVETNVFPWDCIYPDEVAMECEDIRKKLDSLFVSYNETATHRGLHR